MTDNTEVWIEYEKDGKPMKTLVKEENIETIKPVKGNRCKVIAGKFIGSESVVADVIVDNAVGNIEIHTEKKTWLISLWLNELRFDKTTSF